MGKKSYDLSNHLGNVLVTISDNKTGNAVAATYENRILSSQDYLSYGALMIGRRSSSSARYTFNGKETDLETGAQNFGARLYGIGDDKDIPIFWSVDPLEAKYPAYSPYAFVANMPLWAVDPDGRDIVVLLDPNGAGGAGHMAVLIGNDDKGWTYISKDAFLKGGVTGGGTYLEGSGIPVFSVVKFSSLEDFFDSPHNYVLKEGNYHAQDNRNTEALPAELQKTHEKKQILLQDYAMSSDHIDATYIKRYTKAFRITTNHEADEKMKEAAKGACTLPYTLGNKDCSNVVDEALAAGTDAKGNNLGYMTKPHGFKGAFAPGNVINEFAKISTVALKFSIFALVKPGFEDAPIVKFMHMESCLTTNYFRTAHTTYSPQSTYSKHKFPQTYEYYRKDE
ncbi:MAG: hypothetical protein JJT94_11340 [Bernardetiaceae bacterium]|nr:hypothetical protein [Bernardetiaceae bacterium]